MPVTLTVAGHPARKWSGSPVSDSNKLLENACPKDFRRCKRIIQSSFPQQHFSKNHVSPADHGFVRAVHYAYSFHHHLAIRPEDVWFSILTQLNFSINAQAEILRESFVSHLEEMDLEVIDIGTIQSIDFGPLAMQMVDLIEKNLVDPNTVDWIMPDFSTTTASDRVVAAILTMGTFQKYFTYKMNMLCGIPSVTLLGERSDWKKMLDRVEKISQLGEQEAQFAQLLRPVLSRFVGSFDYGSSPDIIDFWNKCVHRSGGSGPRYLSGWITAFCFWNDEGRSLYGKGPKSEVSLRWLEGDMAGCELDGIYFHRIDSAEIPPCSASVEVEVSDNGVPYRTKMVAGVVGIQATSSGSALDSGTDHDCEEFDPETFEEKHIPFFSGLPTEPPGLDSLQPLSGWWIYEAEDLGAAMAREQKKKLIEDEIASLNFEHRNDQRSRERTIDLYKRLHELQTF